MAKKKKDILLFSGGIDSLSAWFYMNKPKCIYIDMKTKYSSNEINHIKLLECFIPDLKVEIIKGINLGQFEEAQNAYIPNRNLILACIASNYGDRIIMAGIKDDNVEDKNPKAFKEMSKCLTLINKNKEIEVYSPYWKMSKIDIIKWVIKNVKDGEFILRKSVSCYSSGRGQCGNCNSCLRKAIAFENCNLDISFFRNDVKKCELIPEYIKKFKRKNNYDNERVTNSLKVFKKWGWKI